MKLYKALTSFLSWKNGRKQKGPVLIAKNDLCILQKRYPKPPKSLAWTQLNPTQPCCCLLHLKTHTYIFYSNENLKNLFQKIHRIK